MNEDTVPIPVPYMLTDGKQIAELRYMTDDEYVMASERVRIATGSTWTWKLTRSWKKESGE